MQRVEVQQEEEVEEGMREAPSLTMIRETKERGKRLGEANEGIKSEDSERPSPLVVGVCAVAE